MWSSTLQHSPVFLLTVRSWCYWCCSFVVSCFIIHLLQITFITGQKLTQVQQEPEDLVLYSGSSLKVSCSITGMSNPDLFWYRWNETAGFILVFTSRGVGLMDPASHGRFKSIRSTDLQMVLESDGVSETDSAVWFCAASPHSIPVPLQSRTKTTRIRTCF